MKRKLYMDLECYSSIDLYKSGVYRYVESPDFEILLWAYSWDGGPVQVIDMARGEKPPFDLVKALWDPDVEKWSHNVNFERTALQAWLNKTRFARKLNPEGWYCSMVWSATLGFPLSLAGVGAVLKLDKQKLEEGKDLIRYFCKPCAPTKSNGERTRNLPEHDLEKWNLFKFYNHRDVETEIEIIKRLSLFPVQKQTWLDFWQDQKINDRGIRLDMELVESAIKMNQQVKDELIAQMINLTDLENPNSVVQLKGWLKENGMVMESLGKKEVAAAIKNVPDKIQEVLSLRLQLAKSSIKKYEAMKNCVCADGRAHGMFQFYGANRTGRFAGRLIQLQNLPQNHLPDLETARDLVKSGNKDAVEMLYGDVPDTLSQLIRTAFIPADGHQFMVADFSAIEARVLAFLAGEQWRLDVFEQGKDIYCASASAMFGVPVEKHGINGELRAKGKIAELALGYGGSVGALKAMGALDQGLEESELKPLVEAWRQANPNIVQFWRDVDHCVMDAVVKRKKTKTHGIGFSCEKGFLFITLPSGRRLAYVKPRVGTNRFGGDCITYEGVGEQKKWERIESYGPKFVENITQAFARDILCNSIQNLSDCSIVGHVHDEVIIDAGPDMNLDEICKRMAQVPKWANGLLLRADGYCCPFYQKD